MSRLFWVAVGAAGGVAAYRKWEQVRDQAREQGVVPTAYRLGTSAVVTVNSARDRLARQGRIQGGGR